MPISSSLKSTLNWFYKVSDYLKTRPILLIFALSISLLILSNICALMAMHIENSTLGMSKLCRTQEDKVNQMAVIKMNYLNLTPPELLRVKMHHSQIDKRKGHHYDVMSYFMEQYYSVIMVLCIIGPITAILVFFVIQDGFGKASMPMKILVLFHICACAMFAAFPSIFQMDSNISVNKALFANYCNLENDMFTYLSTGRTQLDTVKTIYTKTDSAAIHGTVLQDSLITMNRTHFWKHGRRTTPFPFYSKLLDIRLRQLENISIGFDFSKVPTTANLGEDINKTLKVGGSGS